LPETLTASIPTNLMHGDFVGDLRRADGEHPILFAKLDTRGVGVIAGRMETGHVSERHRHTHEAVMIILEGEGRSEVEGQIIHWKGGDVFVIPAWAWHQHFNGEATSVYIACDTLPVMRAFGILAKQADG
jgi:gentisate 1,2-dioxygenase